MTLLIVDDDEVARLWLAHIIGHDNDRRVVHADNGEHAWALLEGGLRPQACCSDVAMPRLGGLGLLERCRAHVVLKRLPFILISSSSQRETIQLGAAHGIAGYILKPFDPVYTRATVDRVLAQCGGGRIEDFQATRQRLGGSLSQLEGLLVQFRVDTQELAASLREGDSANHTAGLQHLHGRSLGLGLTQAGALLQAAMQPGVPAADRVLALREAGRIADEQLAAIDDFAPAATPMPLA